MALLVPGLLEDDQDCQAIGAAAARKGLLGTGAVSRSEAGSCGSCIFLSTAQVFNGALKSIQWSNYNCERFSTRLTVPASPA